MPSISGIVPWFKFKHPTIVLAAGVGAVGFTDFKFVKAQVRGESDSTLLHVMLSCFFGGLVQPELIQCDNT